MSWGSGVSLHLPGGAACAIFSSKRFTDIGRVLIFGYVIPPQWVHSTFFGKGCGAGPSKYPTSLPLPFLGFDLREGQQSCPNYHKAISIKKNKLIPCVFKAIDQESHASRVNVLHFRQFISPPSPWGKWEGALIFNTIGDNRPWHQEYSIIVKKETGSGADVQGCLLQIVQDVSDFLSFCFPARLDPAYFSFEVTRVWFIRA